MSAPNCSARSSSPGDIGIVEDERMQVAVAGMEHIGDAQAVLLRHLFHLGQHLRQPGARNGAVHAEIVGRDAADRRERRLAAGPEQQPLFFRGATPGRSSSGIAWRSARPARSGDRPRRAGRRARRSAAPRRRADSRHGRTPPPHGSPCLSIISMPPGMMPAAMMRETQFAGVLRGREADQHGALRFRPSAGCAR